MKQKEFYDYLGEARATELTEMEHYRVHRTLALLPPVAGSVLDVASGDGRLSRHLVTFDVVVQTDIAMPSLLAAEGNRVQADVAQLPFADRRFDVAVCTEGFEHFPPDIFEAARREVPRVTGRHILLSVPFMEDLTQNLTKCGSCGAVFHKWGHLRRFTDDTIRNIFPGFVLSAMETFGRSQPFKFQFVQRFAQSYGGVYAEPSVVTTCMECGERSYTPPRRNLFSMPAQAVNRLTTRLLPIRDRNWVAALYERAS
jgi:SAM-dependent methyltransferase